MVPQRGDRIISVVLKCLEVDAKLCNVVQIVEAECVKLAVRYWKNNQNDVNSDLGEGMCSKS